jgi:catechol 2,3-dioxygenase-like lactoylglutathione lyase family enzyme
MRTLLGFPYPEEAGLAPLWAAGVAREGKDEKTTPTEAVLCILTAGREGKMEILDHYAFHVSDAEFEAIFDRLKAAGIPYGSGPRSSEDMQLNTRRGGRGVYFRDPNGHVLELLTRT